MPRNFKDLDQRVAMDLHREFHQDMRLLREEEFKLADVYMKITAFAGGAIVLLLTRVPYSHLLAMLVAGVQLSFLVLLWSSVSRIRRNHETYEVLGGWIMAVRAHHAKAAFGFDEQSSFGAGDGARRQLHSIVWCAVAVTLMVCGALYLSHANLLVSVLPTGKPP